MLILSFFSLRALEKRIWLINVIENKRTSRNFRDFLCIYMIQDLI